MTDLRTGPVGATAIVAGLLVVLGSAPVSGAEIEPEADRILREMSDHLAGLGSFAVETEAVTEILLQSGQKIQLLAAGSGVFDRQRGFRFRRQGVRDEVEIAYDGEGLTVYSAEAGGYHTLPVEGGNDRALDEIRAAFGVEAAGGADLLYADPYEGLNFEVESGRYLGEVTVDGRPAHHLAYRAADVDWQLWVSAEGKPLPLRYVITSKWVTGAPEFMVQVRRMDPSATIADADLAFTPPDGALPIDVAAFAAIDVFLSE